MNSQITILGNVLRRSIAGWVLEIGHFPVVFRKTGSKWVARYVRTTIDFATETTLRECIISASMHLAADNRV